MKSHLYLVLTAHALLLTYANDCQQAAGIGSTDACLLSVSGQMLEDDNDSSALKLLQRKALSLSKESASSPQGPTTLDVAKGARVEVLWRSQWYHGVVTEVPNDVGKWMVKCNGEDLLTPSSQIRPVSGSGLRAVMGAKVEVFYYGDEKWYTGFIHDIPQEDDDGTWKVQADTDREGLLTYSKYIRPLADEGAKLARKLNLEPGGSVGVPGAAGNEEPLNWQIAHHILYLRDPTAMQREVVGHIVRFDGAWPSSSQLYGYLGAAGRQEAQIQLARYTLVMRIWCLQALRGLNGGRLSAELTTWFGDASDSTRAYARLMVIEIYTAFNTLKFSRSDDDEIFAKVRNEGGCTHPEYMTAYGSLDVKLGAVFFKTARDTLDRVSSDGTKGGTLIHELSHAIKDESLAIYKWSDWHGDSAGSKCADHGQVGTSDYAYGLGPCKALARESPRNARHNGDSVEFFIETSVLAERRSGQAVRVSIDGEVTTR